MSKAEALIYTFFVAKCYMNTKCGTQLLLNLLFLPVKEERENVFSCWEVLSHSALFVHIYGMKLNRFGDIQHQVISLSAPALSLFLADTLYTNTINALSSSPLATLSLSLSRLFCSNSANINLIWIGMGNNNMIPLNCHVRLLESPKQIANNSRRLIFKWLFDWVNPLNWLTN